jgi:hypothetical protein
MINYVNENPVIDWFSINYNNFILNNYLMVMSFF